MKDAQRVVIYRLGSLGDTVVALPCFHKVAQTWPDAERIVLTNFPVSAKAAPLAAVLGEGGLIHDAIAYPVGTRSIGRLWTLAKELRALRTDVLVYLTAPRGRLNAWRDWLFFRLCGFKHIVGAPLSEDLQRCRTVGSGDAGDLACEERECERLARCLRELGPMDLDDPAWWDLGLTEREVRAGVAAVEPLRGQPFFAINMGGKAREKDWGLNNWRALLARLTQEYPEAGLLIVGAAEDTERAQAVAGVWDRTVVSACGTLNPRESAAAMRRAAAFIGHDSGPLHLAAAAGIRCVGLFGSLNIPRRWHPRGRHHRILHRMGGLATITVPDVFEALREIVPVRRECADAG